MAARLTHEKEKAIVDGLAVSPEIRNIAKYHSVSQNTVRKIYECLRRAGYYKDHRPGRPVPPLPRGDRPKAGCRLGKASHAIVDMLSTHATLTPAEMQSILIQRDIRIKKGNLYQTLTRLRKHGLVASEIIGSYSLPSSERLIEPAEVQDTAGLPF